MSPCVVFAVKLGASDPSLMRGCSVAGAAKVRRKEGAKLRDVRGTWLIARGTPEERR